MFYAAKKIKNNSLKCISYIFFLLLSTDPCIVMAAKQSAKNPAITSKLNRQKIEQLIQEKLPEASIGILVQGAKTNNIIYQYNANKAFAPASGLKVFTTAASLKLLGPDFAYKTSIKIDKIDKNDTQAESGNLKQNVYVQFSGDPSLTVEDLKTLLKTALQKDNTHKITGKILLDTTRFSTPHYPYGWSWNSLPWYFSPPITAVILNENKITLTINSNKKIGEKADVAFEDIEPLQRYIPLESQLSIVTQKVSEEECGINVSMDDHNSAVITGCWPQKDDLEKIKLAVQNPNLIAENIIREVLTELNIEWSKNIEMGVTPDTTELLAQHSSPPLRDLLKPLLLDSNNVYAESVFKTLGVVRSNQGSFLAGIQAIQSVLTQDFDIKQGDYRIEDGSGASRYTIITPAQMVKVLSGLYHSDILRPIIWEALPIWGMKGTLKSRSPDSALANNVHAKTGTMIGITTLSGYLTREKGEDLIFVLMINNTLSPLDKIHQFQEQFLLEFMGDNQKHKSLE